MQRALRDRRGRHHVQHALHVRHGHHHVLHALHVRHGHHHVPRALYDRRAHHHVLHAHYDHAVPSFQSLVLSTMTQLTGLPVQVFWHLLLRFLTAYQENFPAHDQPK